MLSLTLYHLTPHVITSDDDDGHKDSSHRTSRRLTDNSDLRMPGPIESWSRSGVRCEQPGRARL